MSPSTFKLPCSFSLDVSKCHSAWCTWLTSFFLLIILILSSVSYWTHFRSYVVIACHSQPTLQCLKVCHQSGSKSCEHVELSRTWLIVYFQPENFSGFLQPSEWLPRILCFWMISGQLSTWIQPFPGQLPRGDLYVNTSPRRGELPRTPNWTSARWDFFKIWKEILGKTSKY